MYGDKKIPININYSKNDQRLRHANENQKVLNSS